MKEFTVDFSNPREASLFRETLRTLTGRQRVVISALRQRRSDRQNRYYWPCFVKPFCDYLLEQGEAINEDECHELLKLKFLRRPIVNKKTREILGQTTRSTTTLDTREFNEYLDRVAAWLFHTFGIVVPSPNEYHEPMGVEA